MILLTKLTKEVLKAQGLSPKKYLSQNFLVDRGVYSRIIKAADLEKKDQVIEIGPGLGFLTNELVKEAGKVWAIEIDGGLAAALKSFESLASNLCVLNQDILKTDLAKLPDFKLNKPYKVVANIPYHLTAKILKKFLTASEKPHSLVFLVQKEVAERVLAKAGDHSLLSLSVQFYGQPSIVSKVSKKSFYPAPKVDSAILKIVLSDQKAEPNLEKKFWQLAKIGFSAKRKKLISNLSAGLKMERASLEKIFNELQIKEGDRAQHLSLEQWRGLSEKLQ